MTKFSLYIGILASPPAQFQIVGGDSREIVEYHIGKITRPGDKLLIVDMGEPTWPSEIGYWFWEEFDLEWAKTSRIVETIRQSAMAACKYKLAQLEKEEADNSDCDE